MKTDYYIFTAGELKRKDNTVALINANGKKIIPIHNIDDIYAFSHLTLNSDLIHFLSKFGINIHFFDYYGNYTSTFTPREQQISGFVKINQVSHYIDDEKRLYLAKQFLLSGFNTIYKNLQDYDITIDVKYFKNKMDKCTLQNIMSIEGEFRKKYYKLWDTHILKTLKFERRTKRPPENEINALISFGNSLVYSLSLKQIRSTYLDTTVSFLHEPSDRRHSLSLDISEIFKPLFIDRIIFKLVNKKIISNNDFIKIGKLCHLNESGKKKFLTAFKEKIETTIYNEQLGRNITYKTLVRLECYKIIKHLSGEENYKSLRISW